MPLQHLQWVSVGVPHMFPCLWGNQARGMLSGLGVRTSNEVSKLRQGFSPPRLYPQR